MCIFQRLEVSLVAQELMFRLYARDAENDYDVSVCASGYPVLNVTMAVVRVIVLQARKKYSLYGTLQAN